MLGWLWGLFNNTYIALLTLIPFAGFIVAIILGVKGNEWAWRNKDWDNIEHFKKVQRNWTAAGLIIYGISILGIVIAII